MNAGDMVPWQQYGAIPQNPQNTQIVVLPAPYRGVPEQSYQTLPPASYRHFQPRRGLPFQTMQAQHFQARNFQPQQVVQVQGPQAQSLELQNFTEMPNNPLSQPLQTQAARSAPLYPGIEGVLFPASDARAGSDGGNLESFDMDMPLLPDRAHDDTSVDIDMPTISAPDAVCPSCAGSSDWKRLVVLPKKPSKRRLRLYSSIEQLAATQKQIKKALSCFVNDLSCDIDESREWRASIEDKLTRLLAVRDTEDVVKF
jgi:hypothetical protein